MKITKPYLYSTHDPDPNLTGPDYDPVLRVLIKITIPDLNLTPDPDPTFTDPNLIRILWLFMK
jgi:hypothetical protein